MEKSEERREADLRELADRLQFSVTRSGDRFTLIRTADVSRPVQEVDLSLSGCRKFAGDLEITGRRLTLSRRTAS